MLNTRTCKKPIQTRTMKRLTYLMVMSQMTTEIVIKPLATVLTKYVSFLGTMRKDGGQSMESIWMAWVPQMTKRMVKKKTITLGRCSRSFNVELLGLSLLGADAKTFSTVTWT